jgi:CHC2 zinc finger
MTNSTKWPDLLQAVVRRLDRGGSPDAHFPDRDGEYWALCPFHADKHPENFSVSEAGYHCFACGASGGLWALAEKFGVAPLHRCTVAGGDTTTHWR